MTKYILQGHNFSDIKMKYINNEWDNYLQAHVYIDNGKYKLLSKIPGNQAQQRLKMLFTMLN